MSDRAPWEFGYAPARAAAGAPEAARELVVATSDAMAAEEIAAAVGGSAVTLLARAPLFWTRVVLEEAARAALVEERLRGAGIAARYVASAEQPSLVLAPALGGAAVVRPEAWAVRRRARAVPIEDTAGSWFLRAGEGGVGVDRARGSGAGTRLAVIDDDALHVEELELDAEVLIDVEVAPRNQAHGSLMVAWATRARRFEGVAPGASARLYVIPKPGRGLAALPLAIARAAFDGADVIVCATYVEGSQSLMLDDALEVAARLGRHGRGAAVVLPTGRETSSAAGSVHASFSLGLGEPASDPRVICVAPGARGEGWFLWRDRRGRSRPFANRGPAVRWLAPGDDLAYPFTAPGAPPRLYHAESSGAAAVAAGALLVVLGANPTLRLAELGAVIDATLTRVAGGVHARAEPLADPADALPAGIDADGHNAKHGGGLLAVERACLAAADPIAGALVAMGEIDAARAWADARRDEPGLGGAYSRAAARWAVRATLADPEAARALRALLRHLRLVSVAPGRAEAHGVGVVARHLGIWLRALVTAPPRAPASVRAEIAALARAVADATRDERAARALDAAALAVAARCFAGADEGLIPPPVPA